MSRSAHCSRCGSLCSDPKPPDHVAFQFAPLKRSVNGPLRKFSISVARDVGHERIRRQHSELGKKRVLNEPSAPPRAGHRSIFPLASRRYSRQEKIFTPLTDEFMAAWNELSLFFASAMAVLAA